MHIDPSRCWSSIGPVLTLFKGIRAFCTPKATFVHPPLLRTKFRDVFFGVELDTWCFVGSTVYREKKAQAYQPWNYFRSIPTYVITNHNPPTLQTDDIRLLCVLTLFYCVSYCQLDAFCHHFNKALMYVYVACDNKKAVLSQRWPHICAMRAVYSLSGSNEPLQRLWPFGPFEIIKDGGLSPTWIWCKWK